jgi:mono/diheme cytochrome c family protein
MIVRITVALAVLAAAGLAAFWFLTRPEVVAAGTLAAHTPNLDNGRTLFFAGGCASCHASPNQPDRTRLGGGLALHSPFGTFHVPNISSDARDGIGGWSEAQFVTAVLKGTSPAGKHYYPAFPYTSYQRMRVEDVRDLFAFLQTLPAVAGRARPHQLPFPFNIRRGVGLWKLLYLDGEPFRPDPAQSPEWNRGAYLVNGPGHCAECHSPRNPLGAIVADKRFTGGPDPEGGQGSVPNITQARLARWSVAHIAELLASGRTRNGDTVGGAMAAVVRETTHLSPEDRRAIAAYIKSLPPVEGQTAVRR